MARNLRTAAIGWMLLTGLLFIAVTGIVRHLGSDLPAVQAAFVRYAIGLGFMLPFLYRTLRTRLIPRRIGLHVLRGIVHGGGVIWASLLGLVAFGEAPDVWTWVGGAVIVAAATYIAHREALARRARRQT